MAAKEHTPPALERALHERILVLDGAMGTMIQAEGLEEADYRGERFADHGSDLKGNNDLLSLTRPDVIARIHRLYLEAGADIIETNTFNSTAVAQDDYSLGHLAPELNLAAARIARQVADELTAETPDKPRFVAGVLGPTPKTASISPDVNDPGARSITFDQLRADYVEATRALIAGGVDLLLIETIFDTLNAKAAIFAVREVLEELGSELPLMISVTFPDISGRVLSGQNPEAFWNAVAHARPLIVGSNCGRRFQEIRPFLEDLSNATDRYFSAHLNAGLPNAFGEFDETPEIMREEFHSFAERGFLNLAGGCCGTTPAHIRAIADAVSNVVPRQLPKHGGACRLSGLEPFNIVADSLFVNVGERCNVTGSARFKRLILDGDYEAALDVARIQVEDGAQIIDINMGCPAKKVCGKLGGSALLSDIVLVEKILTAVVAGVDVPVTLKIRTGPEPGNRNGVQVAKIAESCGIAALAVHGRTRADRFKGQAEYETIRTICQNVSIPVFANGDVTTPQQARQVLDYTGAAGLMIGRGAQGNPWIFRELRHYLDTGDVLAPPQPGEVHSVMRDHLKRLHGFYGELNGVKIARKHIGWYLKARPNTKHILYDLMRVQTAKEQFDLLEQHFLNPSQLAA